MVAPSRISRFERWRRVRATDDYGLVLGLIALSFVLGMSLPEAGWSKLALVVTGSVTLVVTLWTAGTGLRTVVVIAGASSLLIAVSAASLIAGGDVSRLTLAVTWGGLIAATPFVIVRSLRATTHVTRRAVTGALSVYLLIGMFFAAVYAVLSVAGSDPFFVDGATPDTSSLLYFSYVTQTTLGYGDLTAAGSFGRAMAVTEALLGQVYLVTVVALVVGNLGRRRGTA